MSKNRDWVDYANLGLQYAQLSQARQIRNSLEQMQSLEAERLRNERWEQVKTEREDDLREAVFQGGVTLEGCQLHLEARPQGVLALAVEFTGYLEKYGVSTASFRVFEDKERLRKLLMGFEQVMEQARNRLTPAEQEEAQNCARYRIEMAALRDLLVYRQKQEELATNDEALKTAQVQLKSLAGVKIPELGAASGILAFCGIGGYIFALFQDPIPTDLLYVWLGLLLIGVVGWMGNLLPNEKQRTALKAQVKDLGTKVMQLRHALEHTFRGDRLVALKLLFKEAPTRETCEKRLEQRMTLIQRVLGDNPALPQSRTDNLMG